MLIQISNARFQTRYKLVKQVADEEVRTYEARDNNDRLVMVHFLGPAASPATRAHLARLAALRPEARKGLVGAFQIDDDAVLVTEFLPHARSFDDWYSSIAGEQTIPDSPASGTGSGVDVDGPTVLIKAQQADLGPTPTPEPPVQDLARGSDASAEERAGEFTKMFRPLEGDSDDATEGPPDEVVSSFGDSAEPPPAPAAERQTPQQPPSKQRGEFTRMFGALAEEPPAETPTDKARVEGPDPPGTSAPKADKRSDGFTEVFGPSERPGAGPGQSQTVVEPPDQASQASRAGGEPRPDEDRPAAPRIVWRDRKSEETPPEPEEPKIKIRWKQDEPPDGAGAAPQEPARAPEAPSDQRPAPPPRPPGQFTEIFGKSVTPGSEPNDTPSSGAGVSDQGILEHPPDTDFPPYLTGPRKSVSDQIAPLKDRGSSDYLRALNADSQAKPPPAAPISELDLSPPVYSQEEVPPPIAPPPKAAPGPSEYTQMMSGHTVEPNQIQSEAVPTESPAVESGEPAASKTPTWLWVSLAAIALVALLLIVLIALT
jgi:hypothetical protein